MFPKRGAFAVFLTVVALVALLNYRIPELQPAADAGAIVQDQAADPSSIALAGAPTDGGTTGPSPSGTAAQTAGSDPATSDPTAPGQAPTPGSTPRSIQPQRPGQPPTPGQSPTPGHTPTPPPTQKPTPPPTQKPTPPPQKGFTGSVAGVVSWIEFGPVQVRAVFSNGKITDIVALQTPNSESRSKQIAAHAVPVLRSEALAAQNSRIHTVSGATYTSKAYIASLQSAIDKAGAA